MKEPLSILSGRPDCVVGVDQKVQLAVSLVMAALIPGRGLRCTKSQEAQVRPKPVRSSFS